MKYSVIDIETDGLLHEMTKIYILGYHVYEDLKLIETGTLTDYNQIQRFIETREVIVGHNFVRFDKPALEKILKINVKARIIDSLGLSWYLYPFGAGFKHGLGAHGERLGYAKTVVEKEEWKDLDPELAKERVLGDVEINSRLFHKQMNYLHHLYDGKYNSIIDYITFKLDCLREQEEVGITLDVRSCETEMLNLDFILDEKMTILSKQMPRVVSKTAPKIMLKKDGTLSSHGRKWNALLEEKDLPLGTTEITEPGNPGSNQQLKEWLLSLGWKPQTFSVSKATSKEIPQVSLPHGAGICPSVKEMYEAYPFLTELEGLYVNKHRYGLIKSFIEAEAKIGNGKVYASAHGFTNTLRLTHSKPINL